MTPKPQTIGQLCNRIQARLTKQGLKVEVASNGGYMDETKVANLMLCITRDDGLRLKMPCYFNTTFYESNIRHVIKMCKLVSSSKP